MAECLKASAPAIGAHTAGPNAAKGQFVSSHEHHHVIDTRAAAADLFQEFLFGTFVVCENISGKRLVTLADMGNRFFEVLGTNDRQNGAENLLLHDGATFLDIGDYCRRDVFIRGI